MKKKNCKHRNTRRSKTTGPYHYCAAPFSCNPVAHGEISYTETCRDCGAQRLVNECGEHVEHGEWIRRGHERTHQLARVDVGHYRLYTKIRPAQPEGDPAVYVYVHRRRDDCWLAIVVWSEDDVRVTAGDDIVNVYAVQRHLHGAAGDSLEAAVARQIRVGIQALELDLLIEKEGIVHA